MSDYTTNESKLELSGPTHLLIRQVPQTNASLQIEDVCSQTIPVLLHVAETTEKSPENDENRNQAVDTLTLDEKPLIEVTSLEDFMDIVTTYKCKFCPFSCGWKSGLMSHIRSTHLEIPVTTNKTNSLSENTSDLTPITHVSNESSTMMDENGVNASQIPNLLVNNVTAEEDLLSQNEGESLISCTQEKQIFLCGQCNQGFTSLDQCKDHMNQEHHQLKVEPEENISIKKRRKTKPKRKTKFSDNSVSSSQNENDDNIETSSKRRIRPPRALEEDYILNKRRRRFRVDGTNDRNFRCNERGCGYRFKLEKNLRYHERCHLSGDKNYVCPECNEKTDNWHMLSMHLWKTHQIDMDLYVCSDCDYHTYSLFKLENHKRIHSEERSFICLTCGKGFKQVSQLRNHCVIHMDRKNMPEKRWYSEQECDICHRTFSDSKCLRKHLQAVHNKLKPFICSYCGHTSARKAMLELHMRQHTGEKPFQCDQCDYRTGDHNSLRRHKMRHTGTKPYKCPHCPYACIQAISYKTHLKNKHPGMEGLYACNLCSFRSVSKDNYINHMADHKRGAIPTSTNNMLESSPSSTSMNQIEGVIPNNIAAAQLIYSCLNALSQEGTQGLPTGVSATATADGIQTITIQMPSNQELPDAEQYYLTIQQPQDLVDAESTEQPQDQTEFTLTAATSVDAAIQLSTGESERLKTVHLVPTNSDIDLHDSKTTVSVPLVVAHSSN